VVGDRTDRGGSHSQFVFGIDPGFAIEGKPIVSPKGAIHPSPGQRPGNQGAVTVSSPERARQSKSMPQSLSKRSAIERQVFRIGSFCGRAGLSTTNDMRRIEARSWVAPSGLMHGNGLGVLPRPLAWAEMDRPLGAQRVEISFSWTPMSARPFAVGGRLAVPCAYIAAEPGRVGQALPLLGDRVAQGGKLQAQRLQFEWRLRSCDPEVATANSCWELTVGWSS
jgi:hypothetical protein